MDSIELFAALNQRNVQAFLRAIRHGESSQDAQAYQWLFGSTRDNPKLFESFADHPRVRTYEKYDGQFILNGKLDYTTAAGAYQIVESTWDPVAKKHGLRDFSPKNQDFCAVALIDGRGALFDVMAGRFEEACEKCKKEWASLPGSGYGDQPTVKLSALRAVYEQYGGTYATVTTAETATHESEYGRPIDVIVATPVPAGTVIWPQSGEPPNQERDMTPFIAAAVPSIISAVGSAIPELVKMFGSGSKVSERNAKAAEVLVGVAKEAASAVNEQDLIAKLEKDPGAVEKVQEAVRTNWYEINTSGVAEAREANRLVQGARGIEHNPAMWITVLLLPMVYMVVYMVLNAPENVIGSEVKSMVIGVVMGTGLGGIVAYWLGTSNSSAKKDDALMKRGL